MKPIVVIAASAGGLDPLKRIVSALPQPCTASIFIVWHIGANRSLLPEILNRIGRLPVIQPHDGAVIEDGHVYVAPPDHHMTLEKGRIRLARGPKVNHARPAADPLFISAAEAYRERVVGIVLSGGDGDGAAGLRAIKKHDGVCLIQNPDEAEKPDMPHTAMITDHPDACLSVEEIAQRVAALCSRGATGSNFHAAAARTGSTMCRSPS